MVGMLCWQERGGVRLEKMQVAGMSVLCAHVKAGGRGEERRMNRAAARLRRAGVRRMLARADGQPVLPGFLEVDALPLYRAVADRLILEKLRECDIPPERAIVVLRGEYPDSELMTAARLLCPWVRQVVVDTEQGGAQAQRSLLRQFGVAVSPVVGHEMVVTVRFSGADRGEDLNLCETEPTGFLLDVPGLVLPDRLARTSTLCALWQAGRVDLSQVRICGPTTANKCT